jgi:hypothetical protein
MSDRKNDSKSLPTCAVEYVQQLLKKMRYRRKVRQNVQEELTAHFEDELKACTTDQERRTKAHQLIAEFGDPKLLAVLLRRAKKRCRPLWRTIVARTFQTVGVLVLCLIVYTMWFMSGKPTIRVDYLTQLNQMSRPPLLDQDNAWPHYEKAISLYVQPHERISKLIERGEQNFKPSLRFSDPSAGSGQALSEAAQSALRKWIEQNESHWGAFTAEQKQLFENCLQDGLVPYPRKWRPYGEYRTLDSVLAGVILRMEIASAEDSDELQRRLSDRVIELDPNDRRDAEITKWFERNTSPKDLETGIEVGALKHWIENPLPPGKTLFDNLFPFAQKLVAKWIQDNEQAWREFATGSSKAYCYREHAYSSANPDDRFLLSVTSPPLQALRSLARLGVWRARAATSRGQTGQAIKDCLAVTRAGSHWQGKGWLIEQLVGLAIGRLGREEILKIAATQSLSVTDLKELHQQLMQMYPQGYRLTDIETERLGFLDIVQHVFTDGGPGGGHLIPRQLAAVTPLTATGVRSEPHEFELMISTAAGMIHARRDDTVAKFNELFDRFIEIAKVTPYQRHVRNLRSDAFISAVSKYRYFLIGIFMPAVDRVPEVGYWDKASHQATLAILALKRWRLEKEQYPASLNELVAVGYLKDLPMDPYSDKPLIYKRTDDDFVLYSVGSNFTDDGGVSGKDREGQPRSWRDNGDTLFWPLPKP